MISFDGILRATTWIHYGFGWKFDENQTKWPEIANEESIYMFKLIEEHKIVYQPAHMWMWTTSPSSSTEYSIRCTFESSLIFLADKLCAMFEECSGVYQKVRKTWKFSIKILWVEILYNINSAITTILAQKCVVPYLFCKLFVTVNDRYTRIA